ncbi:MAG: hypothetical protein JXP34_22395 [Planctomycetes bacterium]|nr:hypothetical protein [Planctomycetota bacterium]
MKMFFGIIVILGPMALAAGEASTARGHPVLDRLRILRAGYPRAFFFRSAEAVARDPKVSYEAYRETFSRLMGIEGKVLDEEIPGTSARNIDIFTRFKREHPEQLVLLHFNGNARDPRFDGGEFFAGHWLYYNGARILSEVPAEEGETEIRVEHANLFRTGIGRYADANEDVGICRLDAAGRPDWRESEQVRLVSVDPKGRRIRVRRGCYGTKPLAFAAGRAYAAAHAHEGPWGRRSNLLWFYNYSTRCPRDAKGRGCAEILVEDLARRFAPGGALECFDGLEFDVLAWTRSGRGVRNIDCDADGKPDGGMFDGANTYGAGVIEFCRALRERLGDRRLILADGMGIHNQRAFRILNGIESEGWPTLSDWEVRDWSGGLNRHFYWQANAHAPALSYINHKYVTRGEAPGQMRRPDVPWSIHRLVFAAAVFTDAAVCYSYTPPKAPGERIGIWDELWMGTERRLAWLGMPLAPPVRLAERTPDLLGGRGAEKLVPQDASGETRFILRGIPCEGPDLFVSITARGEPFAWAPREAARLMWVGPAGDPASRRMTWVGPADFSSGFTFSEIQGKTVDLLISVEGIEKVSISRIAAHAHPDAIARVFEHGIVLANPSPRPYRFDLRALAPGRSFRRIRGRPEQDAGTNDGSPAGAEITLAPKDAIFLVEAPR